MRTGKDAMQAKVKRLHYILTGLTLMAAGASLNQLYGMRGALQPHEFLRWMDLFSMVAGPVLAAVLGCLLFRNIRGNGRFSGGRGMAWPEGLLIAGIAMGAIGAGDYGVTRYFGDRFCPDPG